MKIKRVIKVLLPFIGFILGSLSTIFVMTSQREQYMPFEPTPLVEQGTLCVTAIEVYTPAGGVRGQDKLVNFLECNGTRFFPIPEGSTLEAQYALTPANI